MTMTINRDKSKSYTKGKFNQYVLIKATAKVSSYLT